MILYGVTVGHFVRSDGRPLLSGQEIVAWCVSLTIRAPWVSALWPCAGEGASAAAHPAGEGAGGETEAGRPGEDEGGEAGREGAQ